MAVNLQIESPAFDRIRKGDGVAVEDGIRLVWFALNNLYRVERQDVQTAQRTLAPYVQSDAPTANQDNYAIGDASVLLFTGSTSFNLTGLKRPERSGRIVLVVNIGSGTITMKHNVTSDATNRLAMAAAVDKNVTTNKAMLLVYLNSLWREISLA